VKHHQPETLLIFWMGREVEERLKGFAAPNAECKAGADVENFDVVWVGKVVCVDNDLFERVGRLEIDSAGG
jgi:hypothetical protein